MQLDAVNLRNVTNAGLARFNTVSEKTNVEIQQIRKQQELDKGKLESQNHMIRTIENSLIEHEKRVMESFSFYEEQYDAKLYNLLIRRDDQDDRIEEMKLVNTDLQ